jgi:twitching motility protein PilT
MIDYINENYSKHIITIEDPVEFSFVSKKSLINQREI